MFSWLYQLCFSVSGVSQWLCSLLISIHDQHTSGLPMRICCITLEYCITPLSSVWKKANHQSNQRLEPLPQWWIKQFKIIHFLFSLVISSMNMAMYICFDRYIYSTFEHKIFNCMICISNERIFRTFKDSKIHIFKYWSALILLLSQARVHNKFATDNAAWAKIVWNLDALHSRLHTINPHNWTNYQRKPISTISLATSY